MLLVTNGAELEKFSVRYIIPHSVPSPRAHPHFSRFLQSGDLKQFYIYFFNNAVYTAGSVLSMVFSFNFLHEKQKILMEQTCILSYTRSSPGQGHCVVFLGKTFYSHSASSPPRCIYGYRRYVGET